MTRSDDPLNIDAVAVTLLDPYASAANREAACQAFSTACLARLPPLDERATSLAVGHGLAPADAARCVLDAARTACLLRALDAKIAARVARFDAVRVFYAGCGPLAPLALLLARRWRGRGVTFDLIDLHASSIDAARQLFRLADANEALGSTRCADAATLQLDRAAAPPQILLAEVMQRALSREPQVAVVANLLPQCGPDAALVPESIEVAAAVANAAEHAVAAGAARSRRIGTLLTLSRETGPALAYAIRRKAGALPELRLQVPSDIDDGLHLMLATRIEAGASETLADYESGLTTPLFAFELGTLRAGETLGFSYRLGRDPGFAIDRIDRGKRDGESIETRRDVPWRQGARV